MTGPRQAGYDWQPMRTAPRDETGFIAFAPDSRAYGPNEGMVVAFRCWDDALTGNLLDEALYTHCPSSTVGFAK